MASPNFDALSLRLSRELGDPVAAAATDGKRWSSTQRSAFLNAGIRTFILKAIRNQNFGALTGYVVEEAQSLSSNTKALSGWTGGVSWILSAYNVTDTVPIRPLRHHGLRSFIEPGGNQFITASASNQYWVKDGSSFRLIDGGTTTSDSIRLRFIKQHTDLAAGGAGDIAIGSEYWEQVLDLAVSIGLIEKPTGENVARSVILEQAVEKEIADSSRVIGDA